jgi:hypothetical protein
MSVRSFAAFVTVALALSACTVLWDAASLGSDRDVVDPRDAAFDVTVPSDASPDSDASQPPTDARSRPCGDIQPPPIFCEDFDLPGAEGRFPSRLVRTGTMEVRDDRAVTAPASLFSRVAGAPDASSHAHWLMTLTEVPSRVRYEYDLLLVEGQPTGRLPVNRFELGDLELSLSIGNSGGARIAVKVGNDKFDAFDLPETELKERWRHFGLTVTVEGTNASVDVDIDGANVQSGYVIKSPVTFAGRGRVMVGVPYITSEDSAPWAVRVDNAVVTAVTTP